MVTVLLEHVEACLTNAPGYLFVAERRRWKPDTSPCTEFTLPPCKQVFAASKMKINTKGMSDFFGGQAGPIWWSSGESNKRE